MIPVKRPFQKTAEYGCFFGCPINRIAGPVLMNGAGAVMRLILLREVVDELGVDLGEDGR